jgi:hypothetical protein
MPGGFLNGTQIGAYSREITVFHQGGCEMGGGLYNRFVWPNRWKT